jgi:hypothetical protein
VEGGIVAQTGRDLRLSLLSFEVLHLLWRSIQYRCIIPEPPVPFSRSGGTSVSVGIPPSHTASRNKGYERPL